MSNQSAKGYDAPGVKDALDREPLAKQIYDCLTSGQPDWSVRVGLFGSWGLGKTTICDWIRDWALANGHIPVSLKVATEDKNSLWHTLGEAIDDALADAGVKIERPWYSPDSELLRKTRRAVGQRIESGSRYVPTINVFGVGLGAGGAIKSAGEVLRFSQSDTWFETRSSSAPQDEAGIGTDTD